MNQKNKSLPVINCAHRKENVAIKQQLVVAFAGNLLAAVGLGYGFVK